MVMPRRNPQDPKRFLEINQRKTQQRIEGYYLLEALLRTWELQPDEVQSDNHAYIIRLRAKLRNNKNYLLNRSDKQSDIALRVDG